MTTGDVWIFMLNKLFILYSIPLQSGLQSDNESLCSVSSGVSYVFDRLPPAPLRHVAEPDRHDWHPLALHPLEVARQLTLLEFQLYRQVSIDTECQPSLSTLVLLMTSCCFICVTNFILALVFGMIPGEAVGTGGGGVDQERQGEVQPQPVQDQQKHHQRE